MRRLTQINILSLLLTGLLFSLSVKTFSQNHKPFVLVLDAGHGGHDVGARGVADYEKNIALDITLEVGKLIEKKFKDEVKVIYTRKDDRFIELYERADIANRHHADLFVSIHCNSAGSSASGTETFVLGTEDKRSEPNMNVMKRENSVILLEDNHEEKYEGYNPNSPESMIGLTLIQNVHLDNSLLFAKAVEDNFTQKDNRLSRGVKQAGFLVLWRTATPSVLIETGFITNGTEGRYLASPEGKRKTAESIAEAFSKYKKEWNLRNGIPNVVQPVAKKQEEKKPVVKKEEPVDGKVFKIQFLSSRRKYRPHDRQMKGLKNVERVKVGKDYKYYYGATSMASERDANLKIVKEQGFPDAFVVAFDVPKTKKEEPKVKSEPQKTEVAKNDFNGTGYRIQVLVSKYSLKPNSPQLKGLKNVDKVSENGLYKYYFGWYKTEQQGKNALMAIKDRGYRDAFLVLFRDGKKM